MLRLSCKLLLAKRILVRTSLKASGNDMSIEHLLPIRCEIPELNFKAFLKAIAATGYSDSPKSAQPLL